MKKKQNKNPPRNSDQGDYYQTRGWGMGEKEKGIKK